MTDRDEVRDLLGRALGEEPPLRIDRDEVVRQGRKRLRRRRFLEAGSVVAAVVVAAVGAAALTRIADSEPSRLPPAASSQQEASPPPSTASATSAPDAAPQVDPERLTALLYEFGIMAANGVQVSQNDASAPGGSANGDQYLYVADVIRPSTQGQVRITISAGSTKVKDCDVVPEPYGDCEQRVSATVPVVLARYEGPEGQRRTYATTALDNGLRVEVTVSNQTSRGVGEPPEGGEPVLTDDEICALAVKAGLSV